MTPGTILSLCDYSGNWSRPYREAGYKVVQVDLQHGEDVRLMTFLDEPIHGVIAAPPCTHFSAAGAWLWPRKGDAALLEGLSIVDACLRAVAIYEPAWWVLENPKGRLVKYIGPPNFRYHPYQFGDPWTKQTLLWGRFTPPTSFYAPSAEPVEPTMGDATTRMSSSWKNQRSETPMGFARAFFEANP